MYKIPLEVPGSLSITPRPRGGDWLEDDISRLARSGVDTLVSLLTREEEVELGLADEAALCADRGIELVSLPVPDLGVPANSSGFVQVVLDLASALRAGRHVAVHCRQSVGRSGLLAVSIALAAGIPLDRAIEEVTRARGVQVPETPAQLEWLRSQGPAITSFRVTNARSASGPPASHSSEPV